MSVSKTIILAIVFLCAFLYGPLIVIYTKKIVHTKKQCADIKDEKVLEKQLSDEHDKKYPDALGMYILYHAAQCSGFIDD